MTQNILQTFIGLGLVITLFLVTAWLMRRFTQGPGFGAKHIQLLAGISVGTKEKLVLVDAGGKQLLLGVTSQSISTLHSYDKPVINLSEPSNSSDFAKKLQSLLKITPHRVTEHFESDTKEEIPQELRD